MQDRKTLLVYSSKSQQKPFYPILCEALVKKGLTAPLRKDEVRYKYESDFGQISKW